MPLSTSTPHTKLTCRSENEADTTKYPPATPAATSAATSYCLFFFERCSKVSTWVFEIVEKYQGSVSAEHGVGMTKKPYLEYTRSAAEIAYMRAVKKVFDPNNIMNPGKLIDA